MYIDHSMLHAICHFGSSNLRLAVEPKRQIELLLLLRRYLLWLTMLMAFVHALCTRIGPPWQLQHTWIGVRSCAASTSFAMAARSCCTGATLLRFSIFPRTLTGCPSCQAFFRQCESQRVWPRIALVVRREGAGSSSRGSGPSLDGMCWWRPVYLRRWHGLELVPAAEEVRQASSDLTVDDVAPSHINRLVAVLADQQERGNPRLATADDFWQVWRTWQRGERRWREPAYEPGRETAIRDPVARAGRTLWFWLGSIEAGLENLYSPCAAVDSPLCSCATYATASCALIAPGHAELAALSRLALALLGAGLVLLSGTSVQSMDKDDPRLWGARGPKQCPFGWLSGELPMASAWTRTGGGDSRCRSRLGSRLGHARPRGGLALVHAAALAGRQVSQASRPPLPNRYKPVPLHGRVRQQAAVGPPKEGITTAMIDELSAPGGC